MPISQYGERMDVGADDHGIDTSQALDPTDPRLSLTYAEFPLSSLDKLLDVGLDYVSKHHSIQKISLVDIGSGCGRLAMYIALTRRGDDDAPWQVQGVEVGSQLHDKGAHYLDMGIETGHFLARSVTGEENTLSLLQGKAQEYPKLFASAQIVFAYSTAFPASHFSPEVGALILDPEWSSSLAAICQSGCVAITTDRALNPSDGWKLLQRVEVDNPDVFGTTGYIHVLQ